MLLRFALTQDTKMQRFTVVNVVLLACTMLLGARAGAQVEFGIGPIGGVNLGTVSILPAYSVPYGRTPGQRAGIMAGAQLELGISNEVFILFEPIYVGKGFEVGGNDAPSTIAINEIELPLLLKVKFLSGPFRPYAFVGPDVSFVLSATSSPYPLFTGTIVPEQDLKSWTFSPDFSVDVGGGAEVSIMPGLAITADVRYSLGLANIMRAFWNQGLANTPTTTVTASGVQVLVGVMFHVM